MKLGNGFTLKHPNSGIRSDTLVEHLPRKHPLQSGTNFIELLSTKICLACYFFLKTGNQPNFHVIFRISKHHLNTSTNKQYTTNGNSDGNPVFYQGRNFMLSKIMCLLSSSMKLGPVWNRLILRSRPF